VRTVPASTLAPDERPTIPEMENVPAWPNRFARPIKPDELGGRGGRSR
jgi:hypothetical protein